MKIHGHILSLAVITLSCQLNAVETQPKQYNYGTNSDSALHYYHKGWEHIMDYGQWTASEEAFRQSVKADPDFLIGKSLVGKITHDLEERKQILAEIEQKISEVPPKDLLLLEITVATLKLMNARDEKEKLPAEFYRYFYDLGENNYRKFIHKHPNESYMKAEYIEFLHAQHGAQQTLDSLNFLVTPVQKELPFFLGYSAQLHSELGNHAKALELAGYLKSKINDPSVPQPYVTYAQIFANMDSLRLAEINISRAVELDPNHVIAQRLKSQIDKDLRTKGIE